MGAKSLVPNSVRRWSGDRELYSNTVTFASKRGRESSRKL